MDTGDAPAAAWRDEVDPTPVLLFRYSALTMNGHRIHYDRPYAMDEEAYPALVVHGPLQATLLADLAVKNLGKPIATFEYSQKEAADAKAAEMTAKGKGTHFVQRTKEAMPEDAPGIGASIPRAEVAPPKASRSTAKAKQAEPIVDEVDEDEDEDDNDVDSDDDVDDDED